MSDVYGSGLSFGAPESTGGAPMPNDMAQVPNDGPAPEVQPAGAPPEAPPGPSFGASLRGILPGPNYKTPDPNTAPLDQAADLLQQRVKRANSVATNPLAQIFAPQQVQAARDFVPMATEQLQKIEGQKSAIFAGREQARTLGIEPGEVSDYATAEDRLTIAQGKALKGDMRAFQGIQAVAPERAAAIAPQVYEKVAEHVTKAQFAHDSLASMQNEGQYQAKLRQLRRDGALADLEALGSKVPPSFEAFNKTKALESRALREARIGINTIGQKLEERNTYQPMEKKEAETYDGRLTTVYGDKVKNGTWARNGASGARGFVSNGMTTVDALGRGGVLGDAEQRKEIGEAFKTAVPKDELAKYREFNRTYKLATEDAKGKKFPDGQINTNPNVQQGIAEGLASMLRGGHGGANVGLLNIEASKRGWTQAFIDKVKTEYAGGINAIAGKDVKPYLTNLTQSQIRDVMEVLKGFNDSHITDRAGDIARRAGALGFDPSALGLGKDESVGAIATAMEEGRQAQIARMRPNFQAIGYGDGVLQLGAQRPGAQAAPLPGGAQESTQLPGALPVLTPVQQATGQAPVPVPPSPPVAPPGSATPGTGGPSRNAAPPDSPAPQPPGGAAPPINPRVAAALAAPPPGQEPPPTILRPVAVAGQQINMPALPQGASPAFVSRLQRIESGGVRGDPWKATQGLSSASGAFQFTDGTWAENKPAGAPDRAKDATPQQQAEALATLTKKNAQAVAAANVPVNDTSLYIAHNLGMGAGPRLMTADPSANAREVVGERAAKNNPKFFKGNPTVATVLQRYAAEVEDDGPKPKPGSGGATQVASLGGGGTIEEPTYRPNFGESFAAVQNGVPIEPPARPSTLERMTDKATQRNAARGVGAGPDLSGERRTPEQLGQEWRGVGAAAVDSAPAIGSVVGSIGGTVAGGPVGGVAGGAAGGAAGQVLKDYLKGNDQSALRIGKEAALGGVLGVTSVARPVAAVAARVVGAGGVEAAAKAAEGGEAHEVVDAGLKGGALAAGGEAFGRALGMAGHKVYNLFAPDARAAVQGAAKAYSEATEVLATEAPKIPGAAGAAAVANPKYVAAEAAQKKAEQTLKDAGLKPEEAAYAHRVSSEGVPKQVAQAAKPAVLEREALGRGYGELEREVADKGVGAVKATPKLPDGPMAAVASKQVSKAHAELAERTEMAITAPAPDWATKWQQLKEARSDLLQAERDARSAMTPGKTREADDMRKLADTVRTQQAKAAEYVFGKAEGEAFIKRLEVLDVRYRRLMEAVGAKPGEGMGDALGRMAATKGEAGREAAKRFEAFAAGDRDAIAAFNAMRSARGHDAEATVPWTVAGEKLPIVGKVIKYAALGQMVREWVEKRAAGDPVKFSDIIKRPENLSQWQSSRDIIGAAGARTATQSDLSALQ